MAINSFHNIIQKPLSNAQEFSVIGAIGVFPVKAVVSVAEIVTGIAALIIFGVPSIIACRKCKTLNNLTTKAALASGCGCVSLVIATFKLVTLGLVKTSNSILLNYF